MIYGCMGGVLELGEGGRVGNEAALHSVNSADE